MATDAVTLDQVLDISEQLKPSERLRLISVLSERLRQEIAGTESVDILSLAGVGAEVWSQVDVAAYLELERSSWDG